MSRNTRSSTRQLAALLAVAFVAVIAAAFGCNKGAETPPAPGGSVSSDAAKGVPGAAAAGKSTFNVNCARCHGQNGSGGKQAPDLAHVAADADHTEKWFVDFIKDPRSQKPDAKMPGFDGKIPDSDIASIAAYLSTLK